MKTRKFRIYITVFLLMLLVSCSSDEELNTTEQNNDITEQEVGQLKINFENKVGSEDLLKGETYSKNGGETFNIDELKYIISNIILIDTEGNQFVYPQDKSYFLINEETALSKNITLDSINANTYTSISFGFGIDQSNYPLNGVNNFVPTAEENDMLWSWSAGYIFLKLEGQYSSNDIEDKPFLYHVGSHGQNLDNYREITLDFSQPIALNSSETPEINIDFDVLKVFNSEHQMLLSDKDDIQVDPVNAPKIVNNVTKAFEINLN